MTYGLKLNGSMPPWYGGAVLWLPHSFVDFPLICPLWGVCSLILLVCRVLLSSGRWGWIGAIFGAILIGVEVFVHHDKALLSVVVRKHHG